MASFHSCLLVACTLPLLAPMLPTRALDSALLNGLAVKVYEFTFDLYKKISESNVNENVCFSPTSIYVALAMLYAGAGGETKSQLASALHLDSVNLDDLESYELFQNFIRVLGSSKKNYILKTANRLFGQEGFNFKDEYLQIIDEYFNAELVALDFRTDPSESMSEINRWVADMTSNKIKDLFPEDTITSNTLLVLANAVYFKSSWLHKFEKENTKFQTFYLSNSEEIEIRMMNLLSPERLGYYSSEAFACQVLELPYTGNTKVSMIIVLPNEVQGLTLLEERLIDNSMTELFYSLRRASVQLSLPRFIFQQTLNLKETLKALGMENLFERANFSGIDDSGDLVLSEAIHEAYIAVFEEESYATGSTDTEEETVPSIIDEWQPINFIVDRPFLFIVVDQTTGAVLFFGRVTNPLEFNEESFVRSDLL